MYRIVDGVKTPYNVLSAREALELSLNDAEREEFCEIIDYIRELLSDNQVGYTWYFDSKRRWDKNNSVDDNKILALLKYYGYWVYPTRIRTESGLEAHVIRWDAWKEG